MDKPIVTIMIAVTLASPVLGVERKRDFSLSASTEEEAVAIRPEMLRRIGEFVNETMNGWAKVVETPR